MPTINVGNLENQEKMLDYLTRIYGAVFDAATVDWGTIFKSRETGRLFSTKFYDYSVTSTGIGELMNDSVGKTCEASTIDVEGQDDFAWENAFWITDCNFSIDENGMKHVTYIRGQEGFQDTGAVDVGVLTPPVYGYIEKVSDGWIAHFSDSPHPKLRPDLTLELLPWCKDRKGNPMPYGIVTKYYSGLIDGVPYSSSGNPVDNFESYQTTHAKMQQKGTGYVGSGSDRSFYLKWMLWIKYATLNSQKVFQGCTNYNFQYVVSEAGSNVDYVVVTNAQAANMYVGGTVSIGDPGASPSSTDRGAAAMRNIADKVRVTAIEDDGDGAHMKVHVEKTGMNITATTYISSMPLHSGQTDRVLGNDGQVANDGKHAFKIQGVEDGIGSYYVNMDEVMDKNTATLTVLYNRNGGAYLTDLTQIRSQWKKVAEYNNAGSADIWIGQEMADIETGSTFIETVGGGSSLGVGDRFYWGSTSTGAREKLERGYLWHGSYAGLSFVNGWSGLSNAFWYLAPCV